jgi:hypothetical protein
VGGVTRSSLVAAAVDWAPAPLAAWVAWLVGSTVAGRWRYPFDLEWMEGGMLVHALRLSRGQPLYLEPTAEWIPYVYPPGYASIVAAASTVFGPVDYPLGRALSFLGALSACAAVVAFGVRSGRLAAGVLGACVFLGTYQASGAFFDLVRPDGIAVGLLAWTLYLVADRRRGTAVAGGLLLAATFLVKHHVAALGLPLALFVWSRDSVRRAFAFGLSAAVPAGGFALALELRTGNFVDYLLRVPASHPHDWLRLFPGTPGELAAWQLPTALLATGWLGRRFLGDEGSTAKAAGAALAFVAVGVGVAVGVWAGDTPGVADAPPALTGLLFGALAAAASSAVVHLGSRWWAGRPFDRPGVGAALVGGSVLAVVSIMRSHNGGFANVLIPAHLALALAIPVVAVEVRSLAARAAFAAVVAGQLGLMGARLTPEQLVPDAADVAAGNQVLATLRETCDGEILSPYAPWLPYQVGREPGFHLIALWDIAHPTNPFRADVKRIEEAARAHRWACVLHGSPRKLGFGIDKSYPVRRTVDVPAKAMMPKTGWRVRPVTLLLPPEESP